jgi:hypothetical protein
MSTIAIPGADVTSDEVTKALEVGLGDHYEVLPGMRIPFNNVWSKPKPDRGDAIVVTGSNRLSRVQVRIVHRDGGTDIHMRPAGLTAVPLLVNAFGITRKVSRVLGDAFDRSAPQSRQAR